MCEILFSSFFCSWFILLNWPWSAFSVLNHVSAPFPRHVGSAESTGLQQTWSGAVFLAALLPARCLPSRAIPGCVRNGWSSLILKRVVFAQVLGYVTGTFQTTPSITWGCLMPGSRVTSGWSRTQFRLCTRSALLLQWPWVPLINWGKKHLC